MLFNLVYISFKDDLSSIGSLLQRNGIPADNLSENSGISGVQEIEEKITKTENKDLRKKLDDMIKHEAELCQAIAGL